MQPEIPKANYDKLRLGLTGIAEPEEYRIFEFN